MPGMFEKDLIETVHHHLQAHPPCPPWSGNAILALHVFSNKTVFVLKGRNFQIFSAALSAIFNIYVPGSHSFLTNRWFYVFSVSCLSCEIVLSHVGPLGGHTTTRIIHETKIIQDGFFIVFTWWLYILWFLHCFVSSADVHNTNSFTKFAHFINNMQKELFILLALSSTMYAGKLIHAAF